MSRITLARIPQLVRTTHRVSVFTQPIRKMAASYSTDSRSFTKALLESHPNLFTTATQSPFLASAAEGKLSKQDLGRWLANDRLYIHGYIRGVGRLLSFLDTPITTTIVDCKDDITAEEKLLDWMIEALRNVRREEKFFIDVASKFGVNVVLETDIHGKPKPELKLEGLNRLEKIFDSISLKKEISPPWFEAAIIFWATEKVYLEAWTWAKSHLKAGEGKDDADGGACRKEFIPNWTSDEFRKFVDELGVIIDELVGKEVKVSGMGVIDDLVKYYGNGIYKEVLEAEAKFWPEVQK